MFTLYQRKPNHLSLCIYLRKAREGSHDEIDVLVLQLLDDMEVGLLGRIDARVPKPARNARNRNACEEEK